MTGANEYTFAAVTADHAISVAFAADPAPIKPALGKPSCPKSAKPGKKFTVSGTLTPHFTAGAKTVTVK